MLSTVKTLFVKNRFVFSAIAKMDSSLPAGGTQPIVSVDVDTRLNTPPVTNEDNLESGENSLPNMRSRTNSKRIFINIPGDDHLSSVDLL